MMEASANSPLLLEIMAMSSVPMLVEGGDTCDFCCLVATLDEEQEDIHEVQKSPNLVVVVQNRCRSDLSGGEPLQRCFYRIFCVKNHHLSLW